MNKKKTISSGLVSNSVVKIWDYLSELVSKYTTAIYSIYVWDEGTSQWNPWLNWNIIVLWREDFFWEIPNRQQSRQCWFRRHVSIVYQLGTVVAICRIWINSFIRKWVVYKCRCSWFDYASSMLNLAQYFITRNCVYFLQKHIWVSRHTFAHYNTKIEQNEHFIIFLRSPWNWFSRPQY